MLLDFGLAKTLLESERLVCQNRLCCTASDYQLLLEGFDQIGLILNRENPMRDMQGIQLYVRYTGSIE